MVIIDVLNDQIENEVQDSDTTVIIPDNFQEKKQIDFLDYKYKELQLQIIEL